MFRFRLVERQCKRQLRERKRQTQNSADIEIHEIYSFRARVWLWSSPFVLLLFLHFIFPVLFRHSLLLLKTIIVFANRVFICSCFFVVAFSVRRTRDWFSLASLLLYFEFRTGSGGSSSEKKTRRVHAISLCTRKQSPFQWRAAIPSSHCSHSACSEQWNNTQHSNRYYNIIIE